MRSSLGSSNVMTGVSSIRAEGWLIKSRDHGIRFPLIKSKWARRYYKIRQDENDSKVYFLDEYRDQTLQRLRKSLKLDQVVQIDSHLRLADSSCASRGGLQLQWIFSIHIPRHSETKISEVYYAAESEHDMNVWVCNLCSACGLRRQDDSPEPPVPEMANEDMYPPSIDIPSSSLPFDGHSLSSTAQSEISSLRTVSVARQNYQHLRNFHSPSTPSPSTSQRRNPNLRSESGADISSLSSINSSHASLSTEEDISSCSGVAFKPPPIVPPRSRTLERPSSSSSSRHDLNGFIPPPPRGSVDERVDYESSGETIKLHDLPPPPLAPPLIDRSLKPRLPAIPKTTPRVRQTHSTTPTSAHSTTQFEYLEPMELPSSFPRIMTHSSPDSHLDYIKIDAHQTQAIKHTLARRQPE
ncbi:hypothetical protein PENTCL1PPCAC_2333 [Pristionchus entomophagus]|uniref:PH domain-containing protein n=1 Tax=Pristionchus entomophagus TaxID=358040 RepID=A0AAV5SHJ6_9BILA|nr:hypothetical protein PENTCL1PPCAC_2333 [Pristionchus entomophagus]